MKKPLRLAPGAVPVSLLPGRGAASSAPAAPLPIQAHRVECVRLLEPAAFQRRLASESMPDRRRELDQLKALTEPKPLRYATAEQLHALDALAAAAPNAQAAIRAARRAVKRCLLGAQPVHLGSILLAGAPGNGKTWLLQRIGDVLGLPVLEFQLSGSGDLLMLTGLSRSWANAGPSRIALGMAACEVANPLILLDEVDKAGRADFGSVSDVLLMLTEPENARRYDDKFVGVPLDLSWSSVWCTANDIDRLGAPLLSRLRTIVVDPPQPSQWPALVQTLYCEVLGRMGLRGCFIEPLPDDLVVAATQGCDSIRMARARLVDAVDRAVDAVPDSPSGGWDAMHGLVPAFAPVESAVRRAMGFLG